MRRARYSAGIFAAFLIIACLEAGAAGFQAPKIGNLPDSFYARPGLEAMPHIGYEDMEAVNVKDFGALGDGETDDTQAFGRAVDALLRAGVGREKGGIVFIPKGIYLFSSPDDTLAYWNLNPTIQAGSDWKSAGFRRVSNIHFVGEGEDSIIRFPFRGIDQGNEFDSESARYVGWYLGGCDNISLRDLSLSVFGTVDHRYYYNPARTISSGSDAFPSTGIQFVNVNIDQGAIGIQSQALVSDVWVVDCRVRNTTADGIAFYGASDCRALYNIVENSGDDAYALWADSIPGVQGSNYLVQGNTALEVRFGRGILMKGKNAVVKENWVEKTVGAGLVSSASKDYVMSGELYALDNILIRNNMSGRPDNLSVTNKNRGGVFVWGIYSKLVYKGNKIFGSALDGLNFGSAMIQDLAIENNVIAGVERYGINLERASRVDTLTLRGNAVYDPGAGTLELAGKAFDSVITGNLSTAQELPAGFAPADQASPYVDIYASFRNEEYQGSPPPAPSSSGSKASPMDNSAGSAVNVRDFGAVGDGASDDRPAFARAIAALPKDGGTLRIPAGSYRIGAGLPQEHNLPFTAVRQHLLLQGFSNLAIIGDGQSSELIFTDPDMQGLKLVSSDSVRIADLSLRLERQPSLRHNRALLDIAASRDVAVEGLTIRGSSGPGLYVDCCTGVSIRNSTIADAGQHGIRLSGVVSAEVSGNSIIGTRDHGILVNHFGGISREPKAIFIEGNAVQGSREGMGIAIGNGYDIKAEKNIVTGTYMAGISIFQPTVAYPTRKVSVIDNEVRNCNFGTYTYTKGAISLIMGSTNGTNAYSDIELSVIGNRIDGTPKDGVHVDRYIADRVTVKGNRFRAVGGELFSKTRRSIIRILTAEDNLTW